MTASLSYSEVTDILMGKYLNALAKMAVQVGVSESVLRQARSTRSPYYNRPPGRWERAALSVAEEQRAALDDLITTLKAVS